MMHEMRIGQRGRGAVMTRRAMVTWTKIACGAALTAALLGTSLVQPVAAQDDDTIVLTAGGSTLTVSPGNASAVSAVAEAHASPGSRGDDRRRRARRRRLRRWGTCRGRRGAGRRAPR